MTTDTQIEKQLKAKGLTAPRITPADIEAEIAEEHYFTGTDGLVGSLYRTGHDVDRNVKGIGVLGLLTFCVIRMRNGFVVTGESACVSPENFDADVGRKIARENAVQKIWLLMGYALKDQLFLNVVGEVS